MIRITESLTVERPAADVWAVVTDIESHPRWRPALREFSQVSGGPLRVGSSIREVIEWRGRELRLDDVVTALEPERRLAIRGGWSAAEFELDLVLEPHERATSVTFDWSMRPRTLVMRIVTPFLHGTMRRATIEELEGLKSYVERGARADGGSDRASAT